MSRWAVVLLALPFLGCGGSESGGGSGTGTGGTVGNGGSGGQIVADSGFDAPSVDDAGSEAGNGYPSGPYGTQAGDTLADLEMEGYLRHDSTGLAYSADFGAVSFASIRASTDKTHALIHVSGFT
jgi:hypothetical protein